MKILAIIPTHDRTEFFDEAMASLKAQTRQPDVICMTGNVGSGTITQDSSSKRVNEAIDRSDCDAFFILCDDDRLDPTFIEKTSALMQGENVDIIYTDLQYFGDSTEIETAGSWTDEIEQRDTVFVTSLCRKSAWEKAGGYKDTMYFDWDFWLRCYRTGASALHLPEALFLYRRHKGQEGNTIDHPKAVIEFRESHKISKSN